MWWPGVVKRLQPADGAYEVPGMSQGDIVAMVGLQTEDPGSFVEGDKAHARRGLPRKEDCRSGNAAGLRWNMRPPGPPWRRVACSSIHRALTAEYATPLRS